MTRAELAKAIGCGEAMIGHIERGERKLTPEKAIACESVLGVDRALLRPDIFKRETA